ncbi:MAG: iron-containing alcohol dehydrogenase [Paludibacteraceae bacterium]
MTRRFVLNETAYFGAGARSAIAETMKGMSNEEAADAAVAAVNTLSIKVGILQTLCKLGITEKDIDALATSAIKDVCTTGNPKNIDEKTIKELYKKLL